MQALIIDREAARLDHCQIALMNAGVQVTGTGSLLVAETCIKRLVVDLLVIEKSTIEDALGDTLGMAEDRNPNLVTILRTTDVAEDQEDLAPYFPSLHCVVGEDVSNEVAINLGLASLRAQISRFVRPARAMRIAHDRPGIATRPYVLGQRPVENIFSEAI